MRFLFGNGLVLDAARRELRRGSSPIHVEPQVLDLLLHLLRRRDHVVTRDELLKFVWGGRIVSESTLSSRINAARRAIGDNGEAQHLIRTVPRRGLRFVGEAHEEADEAESRKVPSLSAPPSQEVTFCRTPDGVNLAVACTGRGSDTLVKTGNWLNHLEYDWRSPVWSPLLHHLTTGRRLVRYDGRGNGLSDRDVADISFDTFVRDLECVVDSLGLERFSLLGISQGAAVALAYAVAHPERVLRIVLVGAYAQGRNRRGSEAERELAQAFIALMRRGWGDEHSAFVRAFASIFFPAATPDQLRGWVDMQRWTTSPETAIRIRSTCDDIDVVDLLAQVRAPTLVLHCRGDNVAPFDQGRLIAAGIPGARFVALESDNHVLLPGEAEWPRFLAEISRFLAPG